MEPVRQSADADSIYVSNERLRHLLKQRYCSTSVELAGLVVESLPFVKREGAAYTLSEAEAPGECSTVAAWEILLKRKFPCVYLTSDALLSDFLACNLGRCAARVAESERQRLDQPPRSALCSDQGADV